MGAAKMVKSSKYRYDSFEEIAPTCASDAKLQINGAVPLLQDPLEHPTPRLPLLPTPDHL